MWLKLLKNVWVAKTQMYNYMLLWWALLLSFIYLVLWNSHFPYIFRVSIWHCSCIFFFLPIKLSRSGHEMTLQLQLISCIFFFGVLQLIIRSLIYYSIMQLLEMLMNNIGDHIHKLVIDTGILPILVKIVKKKVWAGFLMHNLWCVADFYNYHLICFTFFSDSQICLYERGYFFF